MMHMSDWPIIMIIMENKMVIHVYDIGDSVRNIFPGFIVHPEY